jgi:dTDP-4-dehydrorhamnose reductase
MTLPRVLVLGATGMLGFAIQRWLVRAGFTACGTVRSSTALSERCFDGLDLLPNVHIDEFSAVEHAIALFRPDALINCIAVKKASNPSELLAMYGANALFPQRLQTLVRAHRIGLIHFSTDGVFSGRVGGYTERCSPDPVDHYGLSKLLGEVSGPRILTLRTSLVGRSPKGHGTLLDWLLAEGDSSVKGFANVRFSALTTSEVARFVEVVLLRRGNFPSGVVHLAGPAIDKFNLLRLLRQEWGHDPDTVVARSEPISDRTLVSERLGKFSDYRPPDWPTLIASMRVFYGDAGFPDPINRVRS